MDQVLADTLTANLKAAQTTDQKVNALVLAEIAVVDCQHKTSDRVKRLVAEREADANRRMGAKWAFGLVFTILSVAGPMVAIKICKLVGIMW